MHIKSVNRKIETIDKRLKKVSGSTSINLSQKDVSVKTASQIRVTALDHSKERLRELPLDLS